MKKLFFTIAVLLYVVAGAYSQKADGEQYTILLTGASFASPNNGWFELGCRKLGAVPINRAVGGESVAVAANKLAEGSLYSREELERIDALVIMHVHDKDVYNEKKLKENYTDYQLPFDYSDYPEAYDYLIKRYLSDCYELRNDTASKYYGTTAGKPAVIILCTHWHDARTTYNASIRKLAEKWGFPLVEFDKYIGFSKRQLHPVTKEQTSLIYATGNPQVQDGVAYGWHPQSGENKYIQRRMAATFYNLMQNILY